MPDSREHYRWMTHDNAFPSGKIISTSGDRSLVLFDTFFNALLKSPNAHGDFITYIDIKDENTFISSSSDNNLKIWNIKNNTVNINQICALKNAHFGGINNQKEIYFHVMKIKQLKYGKKKNMKIKQNIINILKLCIIHKV